MTTSTAAAVLGLPRKSLDSMLARLSPGILAKGRQGVERRIPVQMLEPLALAGDLAASLRLPFREAFSVSTALLSAPSPEALGRAAAPLGEFATLVIDRHSLRSRIEERLALAIESVVRPKRGRPLLRSGDE